MDPGKSRNMPLQELLASRRPSPRHFSPVSGYPSFVQAPSLLDPLRRESVGSRRLCLEADVGDVPGRVPVSRCDRESRIPGVIPDYPGLSRIKTFDRPHCARSRGHGSGRRAPQPQTGGATTAPYPGSWRAGERCACSADRQPRAPRSGSATPRAALSCPLESSRAASRVVPASSAKRGFGSCGTRYQTPTGSTRRFTITALASRAMRTVCLVLFTALGSGLQSQATLQIENAALRHQ